MTFQCCSFYYNLDPGYSFFCLSETVSEFFVWCVVFDSQKFKFWEFQLCFFPYSLFLFMLAYIWLVFFPYSLTWTNFEIIYFVVVHNPISMILKSSLNILPIYNLWLESLGELWSLGNNIFYFIFSFLNWFL